MGVSLESKARVRVRRQQDEVWLTRQLGVPLNRVGGSRPVRVWNAVSTRQPEPVRGSSDGEKMSRPEATRASKEARADRPRLETVK